MLPNVISTIIAGTTSITPHIALGSPGLEQIGAPLSWTPAVMSFDVSTDRGQTYQPMYYQGTEVVVLISAGQLVTLDPTIWLGVTDLKIRSGTHASPVVQPVDAEIVLMGSFSGIAPAPNLTPIPSLTLTGIASQVAIPTDFPPTQPGTQRVYTFDFVNEIAMLDVVTGTLGGVVTVGDMVGITFSNIVTPGDEITVFYAVQTGDTLASIATALNRLINGMQALTRAGIASAVAGQVLTISWPHGSGITPTAVLIQAPGTTGPATETLFFAAAGFAGETIQSATCDLTSFEGAIDPSPENHVLAGPTITGSMVSFLVGQLLAGTTYRITMTAATAQQPAVALYSHILCQLPT